jgi:hypothetical protein
MRLKTLLSLAALSLASAAPMAAQGSPVQLSLFSPAQIVGEGESVSALRLNVIYTKNASVQYVDLGFGVNYSTGNGLGVQWSLVSMTDGNFSGWQSGIAAITGKRFTGLQTGAFTSAEEGQGVQFGWVNTAKSWNGLQLGLVNITDRMVNGGLQIGIINVIKNGGVAPVLPLVNFSF